MARLTLAIASHGVETSAVVRLGTFLDARAGAIEKASSPSIQVDP